MPTHIPDEGILKKKQNIIRAATHLFPEQGFEGTTTLQRAPGTVNFFIAMKTVLSGKGGFTLKKRTECGM